jgi:hypothetical protein
MAWFMRRFFTFARWASLALLLAGTALWIASYWRQVLFLYRSGNTNTLGSWRYLHVVAVHGQFHVKYDENFVTQEPPGRRLPGRQRLRFIPIEPAWEPAALSDLWRFYWISRYDPYPTQQGFARELTINVPVWTILALFAILPAASAIVRLRRSRRLRSGRCVKCAYDIRASTGRCPECGTAIPPTAPVKAPQQPLAP